MSNLDPALSPGCLTQSLCSFLLQTITSCVLITCIGYYRLIASPVVTKCCQRADFQIWFETMQLPHPDPCPTMTGKLFVRGSCQFFKTCVSPQYMSYLHCKFSHPTNLGDGTKCHLQPNLHLKTSDDEIRARPSWLSDIAICCHS